MVEFAFEDFSVTHHASVTHANIPEDQMGIGVDENTMPVIPARNKISWAIRTTGETEVLCPRNHRYQTTANNMAIPEKNASPLTM